MPKIMLNGVDYSTLVANNDSGIHAYGISDAYNIYRICGIDVNLIPGESKNYYYIQFKNGIMIMAINFNPQTIYYSSVITFPVSFINNKYVVVAKNNSGNYSGGYDDGIIIYETQPNSLHLTYNATSMKTYSGAANEGYTEGIDYLSIICIGRWK